MLRVSLVPLGTSGTITKGVNDAINRFYDSNSFTSAVNSAVGTAITNDNLVTTTQLNTATANLPTNSSMATAITNATADLASLSKVNAIVTDQVKADTSNFVTTNQLSSATANLVTTSQLNSATANLPTNSDMATAITNAIADVPTLSKVNTIITADIAGYAPGFGTANQQAQNTKNIATLMQNQGVGTTGILFANNAASLQADITSINNAKTASSSNPQTIKLGGGNYSVSSLTIPANVTLEGAGEGVTNITTTGTITMDSDSALSNLTVTDTAGSGDLFSLDVTAANSAFTFGNVDMEAASMIGFGFTNQNNSLFNVTITSSFINLASVDDNQPTYNPIYLKNNMFEQGCNEITSMPSANFVANQGQGKSGYGAWGYCLLS